MIVCAGAEVHALSEQLGLDIPLQIELHARASFRVREPGAALACLQDRSDAHGEVVYAAPMPDGLEYAIGLGTEHEPPVDEALARLTAYAERGMPGLDPEPVERAPVPDEHPARGAPTPSRYGAPATIDVLAGANLFKFGPLVGELLADEPRRALARASARRGRTPRARRPLTQREREREVQRHEPGEDHRERRASAANRAATPEPNTASSSSSRTGSTVGCDAFGATNAPQTTARGAGRRARAPTGARRRAPRKPQ